MKRWLRRFLYQMIGDEFSDHHYVSFQTVEAGKTEAQKLAFYAALERWLDCPEGRAYQAIFHKEHQLLQEALLDPKNDGAKALDLVARLRQHNFAISLPGDISRRVNSLRQRVAEKEKLVA